jgi:two-component system, OmpR family, sensor histidine kinase MprB
VTFRARLVIAATAAVVVAILLASLATYFATQNSLVASLDATLQNQIGSFTNPQIGSLDLAKSFGEAAQAVDTSGTVLGHSNNLDSPLPVSEQVVAVANRQANTYFATVQVNGAEWREIVTPAYGKPPGLIPNYEPIALQVATPLAPVNNQLAHLRVVLGLVAICGVLLAVLLGWLVGRAALRPLNTLTDAVEDVAHTTDVSKRLDEGGVDELGRLRRAFNRLLAALERSRESQRMLMLDTTHELRTPLTSLRTNMEVARRIEELPPEERKVLVDDVLAQMDELTQLVGDMAELSRGELHETPPEVIRYDQLVEECVSLATTHGRSREINFAVSTSPNCVTGRHDRLVRAVGNLLDNAIKWSPQGGEVEVTCREHTLWVRDHGPGINEEDLPHIFDRFYRAPAARPLPGSGLGLAIVAQVATEEGGTVNAGNAPDGGAYFTLSMPTPPGDAGHHIQILD